MTLSKVQDEFTHFIVRADKILQEDYKRYKAYIAETSDDDEPLLVLPYPAFCFGIYVETCNEIDMEEQIKDLLK